MSRMGSGGNHQKSLLNFHFHHHHHGSSGSGNGSGSKKYGGGGGGGGGTRSGSMKVVPKGCLAIKVGNREEEEEQRFVVPILYFNHPEFLKLLNLAEEEYGFDQKGTITIPCNVDRFLKVQSQIDQEAHNYNQHHHHMKGSSSSTFVHGHHHRPLLAGCFRA